MEFTSIDSFEFQLAATRYSLTRQICMNFLQEMK